MQQRRKGICVEWDNADHTIIRWDFYLWTWEDFHAAVAKGETLFTSANKPFYVPTILNLTHSGSVPIGAFFHFDSAIVMMETDGWTVLVGASGFAHLLAKAFMRFNPKARDKVNFSHTLEEARAWIAQRRRYDADYQRWVTSLDAS